MAIILEEVIHHVLEGAEVAELSRSETASWIFMEVTKALSENGYDMSKAEIGGLEYAS